MHGVLKLAVMVFVGALAAAGAIGQPAMAQGYGCAACNMLYQQGAYQCEGFKMYGYAQYQYCMVAAQQRAAQCFQACANPYNPGPGPAYRGNRPLCLDFPNNPACR